MKPLFAWSFLGAVVAAALSYGSRSAQARLGAPGAACFDAEPEARHWRDEPRDELATDQPALRYGQLESDACETELARRGARFVRAEGARGVLAPLRLTGPLRGVTFHSALPASQRMSSPWEIVDCRLALALDDFAVQLGAHDIVEVVHYSIYRPPSKDWPADRVASQHGGALAIDAASFLKRDGSKLDVQRDFHGQVGAPTCGPRGGPVPPTAEALELRQIVCAAAEAKLFNVALTPDYNRAHYNHFHLEVAAGAKWFMVK